MNISTNDIPVLKREHIAGLDVLSKPNSDIEITLSLIWADVLGMDRVGIDDNFFDIGGSSVKAAEIFAQINTQLHADIQLSRLYDAHTIRKLAKLVEATRQPASATKSITLAPNDDQFILFNPDGKRPPVIIVPGGGGNAISLANLARNIGNEQPIIALQSKGLDGKHEPHYDLVELVTNFVSIVEKQQPEGPYYILGVCLGSVVAWEIARQLEKKGKEVGMLWMTDPMTINPPYVRRNEDGGKTMGAVFGFIAEYVSYRRRRMRKKFLRDRLGLTTGKDKRDPYRKARRMVRHANIYACRNYSLRPYKGKAHMFLTKDLEIGRKRDGRGMWIEIFTRAGNSFEFIPGLGTNDLLTGDAQKSFANTMRAQLDSVHGS